MPVYPRTMLAVFALTLFTSATLLFMVQPIIGKMITPLLGGTPAVWNTCMVFFQVALLAGYGYSHATTAWLGVRRQALLHLGILLTPFLFFVLNYVFLGRPLAVSRQVIDAGLDNPIPQLLLLLVMSVGVPFFVISTNAPLLQKWFTSTTHPEARDPYFLYGASNLGSMIALLGYPTIVEPYLPVGFQTWSWMIGYVVLVLMIGACAAFMWYSPAAVPEPEPEPVKEGAALALAGATAGAQGIQPATAKVGVARGRGKARRRGVDRYNRGLDESEDVAHPEELAGDVTWLRRLRWIILAAVPSSLMLGATTYMTTDIAAIPMLWVPPLTLYLISFIIVFSKVPPIVHKGFVLALPLTTLLLIFMMLSDIKPPKVAYTLGIHLATLFVVAMVCHGELARNRPPTKHLTEFFLWMSFGGVVGGLFNGLVAPLLFNAIVEYQLAMVVACMLLPPLGLAGESRFGHYADLTLTALCLTVGSLLIGVRLWENDIEFSHIQHGPYLWLAAAVLLMLGVGLFAVFRIQSDRPLDTTNDILLPLGVTVGLLAVNVLGLWGISLLTPHAPDTPAITNPWVMWVLLPGFIFGCLFVNIAGVWILSGQGMGDQPLPVWQRLLLPFMLPVIFLGAYAGFHVSWFIRDPQSNSTDAAVTEQARGKRAQAWLDVLLPFAVLVLVVGLIWGMATEVIADRIFKFSSLLGQPASQIRIILTFGIPAVLCYTFVERSLRFGLSVGAILLASAFTTAFDPTTMYQERSFFGVLKVEYAKENESRRLVHGTTLHGQQFLPLEEIYYRARPDFRDRDTWPLTYYHRTGPIGHVCEAYNGPSRNLGVIGLGTGSMACYAHKDQRVTFYDIDPVVKRIAYDTDRYFTFIKKAEERGAKMNLVMGDARLTMERKQLADDEKYHLLIVDAFSSDAIPIHLITFEALAMYMDRMAEDGLLCFHISNRYINLKPVLGNLATKYTAERGPLVGYWMEDGEDEPGKAASTWVVLARDRKHMDKLKMADDWDARLKLKNVDDLKPVTQWEMVKPTLRALCVPAYTLEPRWYPLPVDLSLGTWTDDYASIFRVFIW